MRGRWVTKTESKEWKKRKKNRKVRRGLLDLGATFVGRENMICFISGKQDVIYEIRCCFALLWGLGETYRWGLLALVSIPLCPFSFLLFAKLLLVPAWQCNSRSVLNPAFNFKSKYVKSVSSCEVKCWKVCVHMYLHKCTYVNVCLLVCTLANYLCFYENHEVKWRLWVFQEVISSPLPYSYCN